MGSIFTPMTNERAADWLLDRVGRGGDVWLRREFVDALNGAVAAAESRAIAAEAELASVREAWGQSVAANNQWAERFAAAEAERDSLRALHRAATEEAVAEIGRLRGQLVEARETVRRFLWDRESVPSRWDELRSMVSTLDAYLASTLTVEVEQPSVSPDAMCEHGFDPNCGRCPEEAK